MTNDPQFDLNGDDLVDGTDHSIWVKDLRKTFFGDSNLDGEFNTTDLVAVFQAGRFESDQDAGWSEGDWTGDARFGTGDLVAAFQDGGFEQGPVAAVPEPASIFVLIVGLAGIAVGCRRNQPFQVETI